MENINTAANIGNNPAARLIAEKASELATLAALRAYIKANPATLRLYLDRGDCLTIKQVQALLESDDPQEALCGLECEIDDNLWEYRAGIEQDALLDVLSDYAREYTEADTAYQYRAFAKKWAGEGDLLGVFQECANWQGDYLLDLASATPDVPVAVYPLNGKGERLGGEEAAVLLGIDLAAAGQVYPEAEALCVCGSLDVGQIVTMAREGKRPAKVTLGAVDAGNLIFHDGRSGSGNMGDVVPTLAATLPCQVKVEGEQVRKYGVQAVYGFSHTFWKRHTPTLTWE